jgi:uncharacterized protein YaaW (UPF0174 family)
MTRYLIGEQSQFFSRSPSLTRKKKDTLPVQSYLPVQILDHTTAFMNNLEIDVFVSSVIQENDLMFQSDFQFSVLLKVHE